MERREKGGREGGSVGDRWRGERRGEGREKEVKW